MDGTGNLMSQLVVPNPPEFACMTPGEREFWWNGCLAQLNLTESRLRATLKRGQVNMEQRYVEISFLLSSYHMLEEALRSLREQYTEKCTPHVSPYDH